MNESSGLFAAAELGNIVSKEDYNAQVEALRVELLNLQFDLRSRDSSVVLLIAGDDRPGAVNLLRTLHEWMDARYLQNHITFGTDHVEDAERPVLGRYWRRLPPDGRIGLFLGGWPTSTLRTALDEDWSESQLNSALDHLGRFEKLLVDDGTLVLKFWLHLPPKVLKDRLKATAAHPSKHWDIAQYHWELFERSDNAFALVEKLVRRTDSAQAPWHIVESTDARYCTLNVGQLIARSLAQYMSNSPHSPPSLQENETIPLPLTASAGHRLTEMDLSTAVSNREYETQLAELQARVNQLAHQTYEAGISCVIAFEGVDAAGKGGAIRRLTRALPVQHVRVIPISAPNEAELKHHYLWRFWTRVPQAGKTVIFDRSWYGRVLVERVDGFASADQWRRAYEEINEFEETLCDEGMVFAKFWLQIDKQEQLARFDARKLTPYKKYKLTPDDLRNREKWDLYQEATHDMMARTHTLHAPWTLVPANDKNHARLVVLRTIAERMEERLALVSGGKKKRKKKAKKNSNKKSG